MKKLLYIDDDAAFLKKISQHIRERFPKIDPITCQNPVEALAYIDKSLDLLMIDLEMPMLDGKKLLKFAIDRGIDRQKIIIVSAREANYLHDIFPMGQCLCVLNKNDARQLEVLDMVLEAIEKKEG